MKIYTYIYTYTYTYTHTLEGSGFGVSVPRMLGLFAKLRILAVECRVYGFESGFYPKPYTAVLEPWSVLAMGLQMQRQLH